MKIYSGSSNSSLNSFDFSGIASTNELNKVFNSP